MSSNSQLLAIIDALHDECGTVVESSAQDLTDVLYSNLSILLSSANYDTYSRDRALTFCVRHVAPFLGSRVISTKARQRRSFMVGDFTPLEFSWTWDSTPKIRFCFEPVSSEAVRFGKYLNRKCPLQCAEALRANLPGSDWTLFDSFANSFYDSEAESSVSTRSSKILRPSSIFLELELDRAGDIQAKAYIWPVRAEQKGVPRLCMLKDAVVHLEICNTWLPGLALLEEDLQALDKMVSIEFLYLTVDCVAPSLSRLKIYLRTEETSFQSVLAVLTMHGKNSLWTSDVLADLQELWYLVLGIDQAHPVDAPLPPCEQETGGMLYSFDVQSNNTASDTKLYIPVKHYGKNDMDVLRGLMCFLDRRGRTRDTASFKTAVTRMCSNRDLQAGLGFQTYVSCAVENGKLSLTSYLSPQPQHQG